MPIPANYQKEKSESTIGSVSIGSGLILDQYGVLSLATEYGTASLATDTTVGLVKPGMGLWVDANGSLIVSTGRGLDFDEDGAVFVQLATTNYPGIVKVGDGLEIDSYGKLNATGGSGAYSLPVASDTTLGGIKVGDGLTIDGYGKLNTTGGGASGGTVGYSTDTQVFNFEGIVAPTIGEARWYPYAPCNIISFYASIEVFPDVPVVLKLRKNGILLDGTDITIGAGQYKSTTATLNVSSTQDDYITVDIISGDSGVNIFATLVCNYTLINISNVPIATQTTVGVVKPGAGLVLDAEGTLSAPGSGYTLPPATTSTLGGVKVGRGVEMSGDNKINVSVGDGLVIDANGKIRIEPTLFAKLLAL